MKNETTWNRVYSPDEFVPIVAKLAERFTSKESTSITYERAQRLMEAVIYCVNQFFENAGEHELIEKKEICAEKAYEMGLEMVTAKVRQTRELYNLLMESFCPYGNENYKDTVEKALPAFFLYYNPIFEPMENIITMDYPVLYNRTDLTGINAVAPYVDAICKEQIFLQKLPETFVIETLRAYHEEYEKQFFNICNIVLRRVVCSLFIGKRIGSVLQQDDYQKLENNVKAYEKNALRGKLQEILNALIDRQYEGNRELFMYLSLDMTDLETELFQGVEYGCLNKMVVL